MTQIHYVFEDGKAFAIHEGKVIAAGADFDEVQRQVQKTAGPLNPMNLVGELGNAAGNAIGGPIGTGIKDVGDAVSNPMGTVEGLLGGQTPGAGAALGVPGEMPGAPGAAGGIDPGIMAPGAGAVPGMPGIPNPLNQVPPGTLGSAKEADWGELQRSEGMHGQPGPMHDMVMEDGPNDVGYGIEGPPDYAPCPHCGEVTDHRNVACENCGNPLDHSRGQGMENPYPHDELSPGIEMGGEAGPYMAKVVTPNGLKGTILGKVASLWGEEVTVRLENGRIVRLPVEAELKSVKQASTTPVDSIARLESALNYKFAQTRDGIEARVPVLDQIQAQAGELVRNGASYADSIKLDQMAVQASVEKQECLEVLAAMEDSEAIAPPSFSVQAAKETASVSREDASWLDYTLDEMVKEAEATDFGKLMDEGPEAFAAELPDVALADTGVTRQMASNFISEKTAAIQNTVAEPYRETFLARVEQCRRTELADRKQHVHKEAAAEEDTYGDLPDESLFL